MHNLRRLIIIAALTPSICLATASKPVSEDSVAVYLRPGHDIPTGHYSKEHLQSRVIRASEAVWVQVTAGKYSGWVIKSDLIDALFFSSKAVLSKDSYVYQKAKAKKPLLKSKKNVVVRLLQRLDDWAQIQTKKGIYWVAISRLLPSSKDAGHMMIKSDTPLRLQPKTKSDHLARLSAGTRIKPLRVYKDWVRVSYNDPIINMVKIGFVPRKSVITRIDIAHQVRTENGYEKPHTSLLNKKVYEIFVQPNWFGTGKNKIPLYAQPIPRARKIKTLPAWTSLTGHQTSYQAWNLSRLPDIGDVWWKNEAVPDRTKSLVVRSVQSFKKTVHHPLSQLQIAVGKGLYKSLNGTHWAPIAGIADKNPALTYSQEGVLFVNDQVSYDNGDSFRHYINWESIFASLSEQNLINVSGVKINKIETLNNSSDQLVVELDLGRGKPARLYTGDQGKTWSVLTL